jgi:uncharacterized membrane-anchored protein
MSTLRRHWPLLAAVGVQAVLLALVPARQVRARLAGTEVTLRTVPVDPYDVLSGYHVTLRYEAELPIQGDAGPPGSEAWLLIGRGEEAWRAFSCTAHRPEPRAGEVVLRAELERGVMAASTGPRCRIPSAGRFYIPEARRDEVDRAMREAGGRALVDVKVSASGDVALLRLRAGDLVVED